jgi:hypothetical protein
MPLHVSLSLTLIVDNRPLSYALPTHPLPECREK